MRFVPLKSASVLNLLNVTGNHTDEVTHGFSKYFHHLKNAQDKSDIIIVIIIIRYYYYYYTRSGSALIYFCVADWAQNTN